MGNKKCIYSIRKLSLGVASVVVACGLGFLAGSVGSVSADETLAASHILEIDKPSSESIDKDKSVVGSEKEAISSEAQHYEEKHLDTPKVTEKESRVEFHYIDESTGRKLFSDERTGKVGEDLHYDTRKKISEFKRNGYVLVEDGYLKTDESQKLFQDEKEPQTYTIKLTPKHEVVSLQNQTNPKSNEEVETGVVDSPKWPTDAEKIRSNQEQPLERTIQRIIKYKYKNNGKEAFAEKKQSISFERYATVNLVTKEISYSNWKIKQEHLKNQTAKISYVDISENKLLKEDTVTGESRYPIEYSTLKTISDYKRKGYDLVSSDYDRGLQYFDQDSKADQTFKVALTPRLEFVYPEDTIPTAHKKVDEDVQDSPLWPSNVSNIVNKKSIDRNISYQDFVTHDKVVEDRNDQVHFKRVAKVDFVRGDLYYRDWTSEEPNLPKVGSPLVKGLVADKEAVAEKTVAVTDSTIKETVYYKHLGKWIAISPTENENVASIQYPNDQDGNPSKPGLASNPGLGTIPYLKGYKAVTSTTDLVLKDSSHPELGYLLPEVPEDFTKDTVIHYLPVKATEPEPPRGEQPKTPANPFPKDPKQPEVPTVEKPKTPASPVPEEPKRPEVPAVDQPKVPEKPSPKEPKQPEVPTAEQPKTPASPAPEEPKKPETPIIRETKEAGELPETASHDSILLVVGYLSALSGLLLFKGKKD
ncbi:mucin-binding protein [Streptococcus gwangjuense]|uniref:mucin-binding protein n=1 Tax=Streptococcus gwangjuensis TaxID=1433513 RepID=UPI00230567C3|nr:YSIRK-type signal peptide-containing protein [Streptococcus gwangjuense]MDB0075340.1 YSIRK-type signal peptide-containing protein [Streptococcus gwangjuense]